MLAKHRYWHPSPAVRNFVLSSTARREFTELAKTNPVPYLLNAGVAMMWTHEEKETPAAHAKRASKHWMLSS